MFTQFMCFVVWVFQLCRSYKFYLSTIGRGRKLRCRRPVWMKARSPWHRLIKMECQIYFSPSSLHFLLQKREIAFFWQDQQRWTLKSYWVDIHVWDSSESTLKATIIYLKTEDNCYKNFPFLLSSIKVTRLHQTFRKEIARGKKKKKRNGKEKRKPEGLFTSIREIFTNVFA